VADLNVSAFIGTLWEVNDLLAAEFAIAFYDGLLAGKTLGQAFYEARLHVRDRQPANPTWLAYVLYADPNSVVIWGMGDEEGEPREKVVEEAPAPVEPPKPSIDPDELKAALEVYLANTLSDVVRRSISEVVDQAVTRALASEEEGAGKDAAGESEEEADGEHLDSMLFLNALASSQADGNPAAPVPTPNGVQPHDPEEKPEQKHDEGQDEKSAPLNDQEADENGTSTDGPRAQA
jgi:hypothetical protein